MKLTEIWRGRSRPTLSFELFPTDRPKAAARLKRVIDKLAALGPDCVSVTFGAGGSSRQGSLELVRELRGMGLEVLGYFAGVGLGPDEITAVLDDYRDLGLDNILIIRGDEPEEPGFTPHPESFAHASDLVAYIRPRYDFCIGVAGYPEGHKAAESRARDLDYLKLKVEQGADFVISQFCHDNEVFFDYLGECRARGIDVPIVPGLMPVFSVKIMENLARMCGATITAALRQGLSALPDEKGAVLDFGVDFAVKQCAGLIERGVPGIHVYTIDRSKASVRMMKRLRADGLI